MNQGVITFDQVFQIWLNNGIDQIERRDILSVAKQKGFTSIAEWRLATATRLKLDTKDWSIKEIINPAESLPNIIVGPLSRLVPVF